MTERSEAVAMMTLEEWQRLEEDVPGELVDGVLEDEEVASFVHELVVGWLIALFRTWLVPKRGFVFPSDAKYAVRPTSGRKPDVSVFFPGRKPVAVGASRTPPDIMVEVITPTAPDTRRDRIEKLHEYAAFGVRYYWLLDPQLRSLEVLELGSDRRYPHVLDAIGGKLEVVPGCPGLVLDLDELWFEVEHFEQEGPSPTE